jgi:hypothetical protein
MVILGVRTASVKPHLPTGAGAPVVSKFILLLGVSVYIRLSMNESPVFQKAEARLQAALSESFGQWKNLKIVILVDRFDRGSSGWSGIPVQFYALFFLHALKVDGPTANILVAYSLILPCFRDFRDWPADHHGCIACCRADLFPCVQYICGCQPRPAAASKTRLVVTADPAECSFQFNLIGNCQKFTSPATSPSRWSLERSVSYETPWHRLKRPSRLALLPFLATLPRLACRREAKSWTSLSLLKAGRPEGC